MTKRKSGPPARLNFEQQQAVHQVHGPVLILAGAGTGKTRVITARIAHMIAREGIAPENILAVTFTNKAANEMRERVAQLVPKEAAREITISTFHSLCVRILRASIDRLDYGYKRNFAIYSGSDQSGLVRKLIARKAGRDEKLEPGLVLALMSRAKNSGIPISARSDDLVAEVARAYRDELRTLNALDFDDLLIYAVEVLEKSPETRAQWRERFSFIMVDEFQDTNRLQMDLVRLLSSDEHDVCVVGDDDQSIYGWRGAEVSNILDFEKAFPGAYVVKLEQNYRSTEPILEAANSLIRHNHNRREKALRASRMGDSLVRVLGLPGEREESEHVVSEILDQRHRERLRWEDFAVLFRMNAQSRLFEEQLRRHDIPYRVVGGQSFFDRREVKDFLAYLQVFLNPNDDVNLLRIVNTPPRGISANTIRLATDHSAKTHQSVFGALNDGALTGQLSQRAQGAIERFVTMVRESGERVRGDAGNYALVAEETIEEIAYYDYLKRTAKTPDEAATRVENVVELLQALRDHQIRSRGGLRGFLDENTLDRDKDDEDDVEKKQGVLLITLHAAKGLEFRRVFLVGVEEGVLPHSRSVDEGSRDEERRLLYVGITRAMEWLTITHCRTRKRYGDAMPCRPSSFLGELDDAYVERLEYGDLVQEDASEEEAQNYFARMKEIIAGGES